MRPLQGLPGYEAGVMLAERRGQVIAVELGPTGYAGRSPKVQRKAAAFVRWHEPDDLREYQVRFCERLGVKFSGPRTLSRTSAKGRFRRFDCGLANDRSRARLGPSVKSAIRCEKAALSSGCKSHPATAPAGSNRSRHGGDEMSEAFG
jgi:hypothetical protein